MCVLPAIMFISLVCLGSMVYISLVCLGSMEARKGVGSLEPELVLRHHMDAGN